MRTNVHGAIEALDVTVSSFQSNISGHITSIENTTSTIQETTQEIQRAVANFKTDMVKSEEVQLAQENIIRIDQVLKEHFGDYERIRRTVMGVVRDFDINLVRNKTIKDLSEELWLTSSRYWLSYALIALSAWVNNYPDIARNSLSQGYRRDAIKMSLFFTLVNLRFQRSQAAKKWFMRYMASLDPRVINNEAAIMVEAYLQGIFGKEREMKQAVDKTLDEWIAVISEDVQEAQGIIEAYVNWLDKNPVPAEMVFKAPYTAQYCTNYQEIEQGHNRYSKLVWMDNLVSDLASDANIVQTDENYAARIDAILQSLISDFDAEENELKTQKEYFDFVIQNGGDVADAQEQFDEMLRLRGESFNVGRHMMNWLLYSDSASPTVRRFSLTHTKKWAVSAVQKYTETVRAVYPESFALSIDGWTARSNGQDAATHDADLMQYFASKKFSLIYLQVPVIISVIVAILSIGLSFVSLYALIGVVGGIAAAVFFILRNQKNYPKRVEAARAALSNTMRELSAEKDFTKNMEDTAGRIRGVIENTFLTQTE